MRQGRDLRDGILIVTNIRIIWRRDMLNIFSEYRINFEATRTEREVAKDRTVVQIALKSGKKEHVTFTGRDQ